MHGTTYDKADSIVRYGFDFRRCHRGLYGDGVYFASEACKSHQYTCGCNRACTCRGERTMIIARVALGDPFYTSMTLPNVRHPPTRSASHGLHDSVIANPGTMKGKHHPTGCRLWKSVRRCSPKTFCPLGSFHPDISGWPNICLASYLQLDGQIQQLSTQTVEQLDIW